MRGAPQVGFSATISKIKARICLLTGLRSPLDWALESHFQYSRKPARCEPTTVQGVTWMRGSFHRAQHLRNTTQNRETAGAGWLRLSKWTTDGLAIQLATNN